MPGYTGGSRWRSCRWRGIYPDAGHADRAGHVPVPSPRPPRRPTVDGISPTLTRRQAGVPRLGGRDVTLPPIPRRMSRCRWSTALRPARWRRPSWWPGCPRAVPVLQAAAGCTRTGPRRLRVVRAGDARGAGEAAAPLPTFDDRQKPGAEGHPDLVPGLRARHPLHAKRCQWCNGQYQRKMQTWRALLKAGRRCTLDGCDAQVWPARAGRSAKSTGRRANGTAARKRRGRHRERGAASRMAVARVRG